MAYKNFLDYTRHEFADVIEHTDIVERIALDCGTAKENLVRFLYFIVYDRFEEGQTKLEIYNKYKLIGKYTAANSGVVSNAVASTFGKQNLVSDSEAEAQIFMKGIETVGALLEKIIAKEDDTNRKNYFAKIKNFLSTNEIRGGIVMQKQPLIESLVDMIRQNVNQIILTGAPGTGKTYMAKHIAEQMGTPLAWEVGMPSYKFVQFHPSYDYTDFVEGLRPVELNGEMHFKKMDGIFKTFCRKVAEQGSDQDKYFFIIDEINRADLSKVLGELMYGLEKDKRGKDNKFATQYENLPAFDIRTGSYIETDVFQDGFYIPENVVIIGTMNDIDRSVESMDFALRRRFLWQEVEVDEELLLSAFSSVHKDGRFLFFDLIDKEKHQQLGEAVARQIMKLNHVISSVGKTYALNSHYYISQGHFANLPAQDIVGSDEPLPRILDHVWNYRLKSLIQEYVRGEHEGAKFVEQCRTAFLTIQDGE